MKRYAVIPTHDRPDDYADCLAAIEPQVDKVFVIDHQARYTWVGGVPPKVYLVGWGLDLPNISAMWNLGLDAAHRAAEGDPYFVAVLNDDAIVPPTWFEDVAGAMEESGATIGCYSRDYDHRVAGHAFILNGGHGLRADEQFQWWWGDTDLERQADQHGGVVQVSKTEVEHRRPNSTTVGVLAEIAGEDGKRFEAKWGRVRA